MVIDKKKPDAAKVARDSTSAPHPVDRVVGSQIRLRRRMLGMSQEKLAEHLGLTFQQVQKYERGHNRVSASKLYQVAQALDTDIGYFFTGAEAPDESSPSPRADQDAFADFLSAPDGVDLIQVWPKVPLKSRRKILSLLRVLAGEEEDEG